MTDSLNTTTDLTSNSWQNEYLKSLLQEGVVSVLFKKKDGTERRMTCTLSSQFLPHKEETLKPRHSNPDVLAVWDMEKEDWRSFRYDSVIGFSPYMEWIAKK
jgi:hypothetical protein